MNIGGAETSVIPCATARFTPVLLSRRRGAANRIHGIGRPPDMGTADRGGISTSDAHLNSRRDTLKRWTRAMVKSLQFIKNPQRRDAENRPGRIQSPARRDRRAWEICMKAIDAQNPRRRERRRYAQNIDLTITPAV